MAETKDGKGDVNRGKRPTIYTGPFGAIRKRNKEAEKYGANTGGVIKPNGKAKVKKY